MKFLKPVLASSVLSICVAFSAMAQQGDVDDLFTALQDADAEAAQPIARKIIDEWSKSGSAAMDLLLARGREMMEQGDMVLAVEHFSALIDHAPDFTEAYNARATAFFQLNRYGESLGDLRVVLSMNPRHFGALSGMGTLLEELGQPVRALEAWRRVVEIYPAEPNAARSIRRLQLIAEGVEL